MEEICCCKPWKTIEKKGVVEGSYPEEETVVKSTPVLAMVMVPSPPCGFPKTMSYKERLTPLFTLHSQSHANKQWATFQIEPELNRETAS